MLTPDELTKLSTAIAVGGAVVGGLSLLHLLTTGAAMGRAVAAQDSAPADNPSPSIPDGFERVWTQSHPLGHCDCHSVRRRADSIEHYRHIWFWQVGTYLGAGWTVSYGWMFGGWYALNPIEWLVRLLAHIRPEAYGDFPIPSSDEVEWKIPVDARHGIIGNANIEAPFRPAPLAGEELHLRGGQIESHLPSPALPLTHDETAVRGLLDDNARGEARPEKAAMHHDDTPLIGAGHKTCSALSGLDLIQVRSRRSHLLSVPGYRVLPDQQDRGCNRAHASNCAPVRPIEIHGTNPLLPSARA